MTFLSVAVILFVMAIVVTWLDYHCVHQAIRRPGDKYLHRPGAWLYILALWVSGASVVITLVRVVGSP